MAQEERFDLRREQCHQHTQNLEMERLGRILSAGRGAPVFVAREARHNPVRRQSKQPGQRFGAFSAWSERLTPLLAMTKW